MRVYDSQADAVLDLAPADCGFAYRPSVFKHQPAGWCSRSNCELAVSRHSAPIRYAELAAALGVSIEDRADTDAVREAVLKLRAGKGMVLDPADPDTFSVGSFFTNPVLDGAAYAAVEERAADRRHRHAGGVAGAGRLGQGQRRLADRAGRLPQGLRRHRRRDLVQAHAGPDQSRPRQHRRAARRWRERFATACTTRFGVMLHPEPVLVNCSID